MGTDGALKRNSMSILENKEAISICMNLERHKKIGLAEKKNKLNKNTPQLINIVFTGILGKIKNR